MEPVTTAAAITGGATALAMLMQGLLGQQTAEEQTKFQREQLYEQRRLDAAEQARGARDRAFQAQIGAARSGAQGQQNALSTLANMWRQAYMG